MDTTSEKGMINIAKGVLPLVGGVEGVKKIASGLVIPIEKAMKEVLESLKIEYKDKMEAFGAKSIGHLFNIDSKGRFFVMLIAYKAPKGEDKSFIVLEVLRTKDLLDKILDKIEVE